MGGGGGGAGTEKWERGGQGRRLRGGRCTRTPKAEEERSEMEIYEGNN